MYTMVLQTTLPLMGQCWFNAVPASQLGSSIHDMKGQDDGHVGHI